MGTNLRMTRSKEQENFRVVEKALFQVWEIANQLATVQPPSDPYYRVTIFGSARIKKNDELYESVKKLASALSALGCDIITGGGPGLMEAANEGEVAGDPENKTRSFGLSIELPFEEVPSPFIEKLYKHKTFFSRLHHFAWLSNAFVVVPGGLGTVLEAMMIWQLLQVKHLKNTPLIFVGGMWRDLVKWAHQHMLGEYKLASPEDLEMPICVNSVDEVIPLIEAAKKKFEESREPTR
jgi:uncharacterized protein (TIGR00730 family)